MTLPRIKVVTFFLLLSVMAVTAESEAPANNHSLILSGAVVTVTPDLSTASDRPFAVYAIQLQLQLRNDGSQPVILLNPARCEKKLEFVSAATFQHDQPADLIVTPWLDPARLRNEFLREYEEVRKKRERDWLEELSVEPTPTAAGLLIIGPGEVYEFRESITVDAGFSLEIRPGQTYDEVKRNTPTSQFHGLRIQYHRSLRHKQSDDLILLSIRDRWKPFGYLMIDRHGDFSIRSETILNRTS